MQRHRHEQDIRDEYNFDVNCQLVAEERGLVVVYPNENQLFLDIDTYEQYEEFRRRWQFFDYDEVRSIEEFPSRSGGEHKHIIITFFDDKLTEERRILLQSALNDDPIRSYLNVLRLEKEIERPSRLFMTQENADKVKTL